MEDQRAHTRIDGLEGALKKHFEDHARFEFSLHENTELTKKIAGDIATVSTNTSELVTLVRGAKGLRKFAVWITPLAIVVGAVWAWLKAH